MNETKQSRLEGFVILACVLLFIFCIEASAVAGTCSTIKDIYSNAEHCDGQQVVLKGQVSKLKHQKSGKGNKYTTFLVSDNTSRPMKVFTFSHLQDISEGDSVMVSGTFKKVSATKDYEFPMQVNTTPADVKRELIAQPRQREVSASKVARPEPVKQAENVQKKEIHQEPPKEIAKDVVPPKVEDVPPKPAPVDIKKPEEKPFHNSILFLVLIAVVVTGAVVIVILKLGTKKAQPRVQKNVAPDSVKVVVPAEFGANNKTDAPSPSAPPEVVQNDSDAQHAVGAAFEDYVLSRFDMRDWVVVDRTKDFSKELGRRVESDSNPDLVFRHKDTKKVVAVECKYRSKFAVTKKGDQYITWASEFNIKNYNAYREKTRGHRGRSQESKKLDFPNTLPVISCGYARVVSSSTRGFRVVTDLNFHQKK